MDDRDPPPSAVAIVGDVLVDVVVAPATPLNPGSDTPSRITWGPGGAAANVARHLARLDVEVRLVGRVGDDVAGRWLLAQLAHVGVGVDGVVVAQDGRTGTVVALHRDDGGGPDRDMLTDRGASADLSPDDLPQDWLDGVGHVHLSGYTVLHPATRPVARRVLAQARAAALPVSVDPASAAPLRTLGGDAFLELVGTPVLLCPNAEEAAVLTGLQDPVEASLALAVRCGETLVSDGARGVVWSDGREVVRQAAVGVDGPVDPVGAGDALLAGLLATRVQGRDVPTQLAAAVRVAAGAIRRGSLPVSHQTSG